MLAPSHSLSVEKLGGLAGFGTPQSPLRSRGTVDASSLSLQDLATVNSFFSAPPPDSQVPDGFRYRITRQGSQGEESVEVPEHLVPESISTAVQDELA
jgi:hypothetical protein